MWTLLTMASPWVPGLILLLPILYYLLKPSSIPSIPNATPRLPLLGNAIFFGINPIKFLKDNRARHGDIFLVDLVVIRIVFCLGPEGTNAVLKGTERAGISLWAALEYVIGGAVTKGLAVEGWLDTSLKIMTKVLSAQENLEHWKNVAKPIVKTRFEKWAETGECVSLFRGMSDIVMTEMLYLIMGDEFAEEYAEELVPIVRNYESAMQKPQTKAVPRWASGPGRCLDYVENRLKVVLDKEIALRMNNPDKYKNNKDYLQFILNAVGDKYAEIYPYHILGLWNGAHTNQTSTFVWSLLHISKNPALLAALRERKSNDLLEATFRETGRLYTNLLMLRRITAPQTILGKSLPKNTFVACSPLVTARDPTLFSEPDKFQPERWLVSGEFDEGAVKKVLRQGASVQFGKGQHICLGEKMGRMMVMDILWDTLLGDSENPGYDVEIVSGLRDGVGVDGVGVEAAWAEENLGTPFEKGDPVMVRFHKRERV